MPLNTSVVEPGATARVYEPSAPVLAPDLWPFRVTLTPAIGVPLSSETLPVIVFVWENTFCVKSTQSRVKLTHRASDR